MGARRIGELVAPVIAQAIGIARLQDFLACFDSRARKEWIMDWWEGGTISSDEAMLLIQHNELENA
jgi:hypothetical protein